MIKSIINPDPLLWKQLCLRPLAGKKNIESVVKNILSDVKYNGDKALVKLTKEFSGYDVSAFKADKAEIESASDNLTEELKEAIIMARRNIEKFHRAQVVKEEMIETVSGVCCWRTGVAIEKVGLYIPGGNAPLFSTVLMLGIPAVIAGCREIVLCTPPDRAGKIHPAILFCAELLGIKSVYKVGGAQAIAAMAYGTESIPAVNKIFGPGNQYVTKAKELVQSEGIAIDMPAGPSEVLVIADSTANPEFVAADLLSQAEHGPDSQVVLLTTDIKLLEKVRVCLDKQSEDAPNKAVITDSLEKSMLVLLGSIDDCISFSNIYAPEHLIIATDDPFSAAEGIKNAGSVFLGNYSCESAGDYTSGTNHTLPTNGFAKSFSGLSVDSFVRKITFQSVSADGLRNIGKATETMAEAETLYAHKNAVTIRLKTLSYE